MNGLEACGAASPPKRSRKRLSSRVGPRKILKIEKSPVLRLP